MTGQRPTYTQISRMVGANWKRISPEKKAAYEALALKEKRRFALELVSQKLQLETQQADELPQQAVPAASASSLVAENKNLQQALESNDLLFSSSKIPEVCPHAGVNPLSPSFQAMLRQSMAETPVANPTPFFSVTSSQMVAQLALLSAMMIDYVSKVAPEKLLPFRDCELANSVHLTNTSTTGAASALPFSPHQATIANEPIHEQDVEFLPEGTFGLDGSIHN